MFHFSSQFQKASLCSCSFRDAGPLAAAPFREGSGLPLFTEDLRASGGGVRLHDTPKAILALATHPLPARMRTRTTLLRRAQICTHPEGWLQKDACPHLSLGSRG